MIIRRVDDSGFWDNLKPQRNKSKLTPRLNIQMVSTMGCKLINNLLLASVAVLCASTAWTNAGTVDMLPGIAQVKYLEQLAPGNQTVGLTKENSSAQAPKVLQVKSIANAINGDTSDASEAQYKFSSNTKEGSPFVRHSAGAGLSVPSEPEKGWDAIEETARHEVGAVEGGIGGPLGAYAGEFLVDFAVALVDWARNKEFRPRGIFKKATEIHKTSVSQIVDELFAVVLDSVGFSDAQKVDPKYFGFVGEFHTAHGAPLKGNTMSKARLADERRINKMVSDEWHDDLSKPMLRSQRLSYLQLMVYHLDEDHQRHLDEFDFRDINSRSNESFWCACPLAGFLGITMSELEQKLNGTPVKQANLENSKRSNMTLNIIVEFYKNAGFPNARITRVTEATLLKEVRKRVLTMRALGFGTYRFLYQFSHQNGSNVVAAKAWIDSKGDLQTLTTDYQVPPEPPCFSKRFYDSMYGNGTATPNRRNFIIYDMYGDIGASKTDSTISMGAVRPSIGQISRNIEQLEHAQSSITSLPDSVWTSMSRFNFLSVKGVEPASRGSWSLLAAMNMFTLPRLRADHRMKFRNVYGVNRFEDVLSMFREVGFPQTVVTFRGSKEELVQFLDKKVAPGREAEFALAYETDDGPAGGVYVVSAMAWKEEGSGELEFLFTDFEYDRLDSRRFRRSIDTLEAGNGKLYYILIPLKVERVSPTSIKADSERLDAAVLERGAGCRSKRIVGYLASWSKVPLAVDQATRFTHLVYASAKMDASGGLRLPDNELAKQRLLDAYLARETIKLRGHQLKLLFAVGGWENSQHFSGVLGNTSLRSEFIGQIRETMEYNDFDGVFIEWEYPGISVGGRSAGKYQDRVNYVLFVEELRRALGPSRLISIAAAAGEEALRSFDIANLVKHLDWINVMTHDFDGPQELKSTSYVGHNSPLYNSAPSEYSSRSNVDWTIKQYVCHSRAPNKIVLSLPFFGRYWYKTTGGPDASNQGVYRVAERIGGIFGGEESYHTIKDLWNTSSSGFEFHWDAKAQVPWAMHPQTTAVISFDDPESIRAKVAYALQHNLGGVMARSLGHDDDELSMTRELEAACSATGESINYRCHTYGAEKRSLPRIGLREMAEPR